ncbi:MAG: tRNA uridine-5-carboxymethylaminomethyl(34) synthesis GTPase MnmE [Clostridiales bacterium]|nr:tRNA uridine-5-carboxymethylaminomethyl(34) synthesis GTPase MnmE [Clostridiales bacterium]
MMGDTIAAISTPLGEGGVGMIRISGEEARGVAHRIFRSSRGDLRISPGYRAYYGRVAMPGRNETIDEAVALVFAAPASYTGEDVVELSVHGGVYVVRQVLRAALAAGARLAQPGEFTRRAYLNGKLDLTQAESVMHLISAQGEDALRAARSGREGAVSRRVTGLKERLLAYSAALAAWADYPDEDIPALQSRTLIGELSAISADLQALLATYDGGRVLREGVETVIAGRPNVGKSTLMNLLAGCQRSIVTPVAGTTRDVVEETVLLGDLRLRLADTAGLRQTEDLVESIGVGRTRERLAAAGLILAVFDASLPLEQEDRELLDLLSGRPAVAVVNKTDLSPRLNLEEVGRAGAPVVQIAAGAGRGLEELKAAVEQVAGLSGLDPAAGILASERQRDCAVQAQSGLAQALAALELGETLDAVSVCLDDALQALLSLTGERVTTAVTDEVFKRFCVGK